jgi:hypothetical protein
MTQIEIDRETQMLFTKEEHDDYVELENIIVDGVSQKGTTSGAFLIRCDNFDGQKWVPKSQLRADFDDVIYISEWFNQKLKEEG